VLDAMRDREDCQRESSSWLFALAVNQIALVLAKAESEELHHSYFLSPSLNIYLIEGL